jgi:Zn-dependent peptidase ImmA (M78 family)
MNTVKIGDKFEDKSYHLIVKAIENDELGISKSSAKVFRKKGYFSARREKEIIFDLSIEIWPKNARRYSLLFLIECKSSNSKKVPVDDVEEFWGKIDQVAGKNVKGVMISDNCFQGGGLTFAKNTGMMLIEVDNEDNHSIILHRTEKEETESNEKSIDDIFFSFVNKTLGLKKVQGLKKLSVNDIENLATPILDKYNKLHSAIEIDSFIEFLKTEYELSFDFTKSLETVNGKQIAGYFDIENKAILIDASIGRSEKSPFVLGHELGHFFLHSELKINQERYNEFEDSHYDFFSDKHILVNDRNWIEWQANKFAIALFLPKVLFIPHLIAFRTSIGISRPYHIHLDSQSINQQDFYKTVEYLSNYFGISKTTVKFRIEEFELITYEKPKEEFRDVIRRAFYE